MKMIRLAVGQALMIATFVAFQTACSDRFLQVTNPSVIDAASVDPMSGATTLANSAQQNFATAYGWLVMYSSWFTGETNASDTFFTRNEFALRTISDDNTNLNGDLWTPLSLAAASTKVVLDLTLPNEATNINRARAATFRGFSILHMATDFCTGALSGGPELTANQMLDSAIAWFTVGADVGTANATADGLNLANASLVGRARAKLQKGDKAGALADANAVPAAFNYNLTYVDDAANRTRLSNRLWFFTFDRGSISVAAAYQVSDPRVLWLPPSQHKLAPQDPSLPGGFFIQQKYPAYASPVRLASKLEAEYIAAEASSDITQQLALINRQRVANRLAAYAGPTDAASVLTELFTQRSREFFLEGKRLADFRRQPTATLFVPATGTPYIKPGYVVGNNTCYPLPRNERVNNPNITKP